MSDWDPTPSWVIQEGQQFKEAMASVTRGERALIMAYLKGLRSRPKKRGRKAMPLKSRKTARTKKRKSLKKY